MVCHFPDFLNLFYQKCFVKKYPNVKNIWIFLTKTIEMIFTLYFILTNLYKNKWWENVTFFHHFVSFSSFCDIWEHFWDGISGPLVDVFRQNERFRFFFVFFLYFVYFFSYFVFCLYFFFYFIKLFCIKIFSTHNFI